MYYPSAVQVIDSEKQLFHDVLGLILREPATVAQPFKKISTLLVVEYEIYQVVVLIELLQA